MAHRRVKGKREVSADARRTPDRYKVVKANVYGALKWTALRILEGGLPEAGKVLFRIGAGGLVALVGRWLYGE